MRPAGAFFQSCVQLTKCNPLILVSIKDFRHILGHADYRQMLSKLCENRWPAEPTVHEEIVCLYTVTEYSFNHCLQKLSRFSGCLLPPPVTTSSLIQYFFDALHPLVLFGRGEQNKIQRKEAEPIGLPQSQKLKPFQGFFRYCDQKSRQAIQPSSNGIYRMCYHQRSGPFLSYL